MDDDKSTLFSLVLVAVVSFFASIVVSVATIAQAVQNVMIAYFPHIAFLVFTAIVLFFVYKLFTKRWLYDYLERDQ